MINKCMRNYDAHDIQAMVEPFLPKFQYLLVIHSNFRPKDKSQKTIEFQQLKRSAYLEESLKDVSKSLFKSDPMLPFKNRYKYAPYRFTTVEGVDPLLSQEKTLHFNMLIGNLPIHYSKEELLATLLKTWNGRFKQQKDIWIRTPQDLVDLHGGVDTPISVFNRYILKDAYKEKSNAWKVDGVWDVRNTWLPHEAISLN